MQYNNHGDNIANKFIPNVPAQEPPERIAHALEFIAAAMGRIDHKLQLIAREQVKK